MKKLSSAAAAMGKAGGSKKVPKGFSKTDAAAASKKGNVKRWGKEVKLTIYASYFPRDEEKILEAGRKANEGVEMSGESKAEYESRYNSHTAALNICCKALTDAGFVSFLFKGGLSPRLDKSLGTEEEWLKYNEGAEVKK